MNFNKKGQKKQEQHVFLKVIYHISHSNNRDVNQDQTNHATFAELNL